MWSNFQVDICIYACKLWSRNLVSNSGWGPNSGCWSRLLFLPIHVHAYEPIRCRVTYSTKYQNMEHGWNEHGCGRKSEIPRRKEGMKERRKFNWRLKSFDKLICPFLSYISELFLFAVEAKMVCHEKAIASCRYFFYLTTATTIIAGSQSFLWRFSGFSLFWYLSLPSEQLSYLYLYPPSMLFHALHNNRYTIITQCCFSVSRAVYT